MHTPAPANHKWLILLAVGVGTFMSALDGSVVNTTLPVMRLALGSDVAAIEWVVTVYLLVVSGLLLSFGRLGDLRGHKQIYVAGFVIFTASSALCGLAPTTQALVAFRGLQALGAAMLFANSPAILTGNFPPAQRGRVLGLQATMTYLGLMVGPSLGGWLAQASGWRAVFYINIPVGLTALLLSQRFIPRDAPAEHAEPFDLAGAVTFTVGLVLLLLALNQGHQWGWVSLPTLMCLTGAIAILAGFIVLQGRVRTPMLDLSLFRRRIFAVATATAVLNYICLYSITFLLPFYLIQGRGLNPAQAGLILTAQPLIMAVAAPISGALSDRIGSQLLSTLGMGILAIALFFLSRLGPATSFGWIAAALAVAGLGNGLFVSPNTSSLLGAAPRGRQGIASGVLATARTVGMALGIGLAGAILTTVLAGGDAANSALFTAVQISFLVAAGIALVGMAGSAVRGK